MTLRIRNVRFTPESGHSVEPLTADRDDFGLKVVQHAREYYVVFKVGRRVLVGRPGRATEATMTVVTKLRTDETAPSKAHMLIGGNWVDSASGEVLEVEDPAHRRSIAVVPRGRAEDVARAVKAAADAFPAWSRSAPQERGRLLARIADALEPRVEELARTIALETGNALRTQARPEAKSTVDILRYFGGLGGELKGETIPFGEHVLATHGVNRLA
jgi:delta 1-pyrroline-5-carboxylate dehydrogenase